MEKMPPLEKVYEAYSAIADNRVAMAAGSAQVRASNGAKTYTVQWEGDAYRSSDSATYWQGYPGYPVIAVLMLQGRLPLDRDTAALFAGIDWNALKKKHKRDYAAAAGEVLGGLAPGDAEAARAEANRVFAALSRLSLTMGRARAKTTP